MQFDNFAHSYTQNAFIQKDLITWGAPFFDTLSLTHKSILELGAGTGLLTKYLLEKNISHILATDKSPDMIIEGKKRVHQAQWQLLDAWNTIPHSFDHIFSSSLLQWAPNPLQTISNWASKLPESGSIHALFYIDQTLTELRQLISLENTLEWRTLEDWAKIFTDSGLTLHLYRVYKKIYQFPSALDLFKNLKYTGTSLKNHLCGNYLKKVIKNYNLQFPSSIGVYSTWHFCQIIATKS